MSIIPRILSIQSHTVHGYVGNKAATFPLQLLGFDVDAINTVSLSNHPAYPKLCKGSSLQPLEFKNLLDGLEDNELFGYDAILTGYNKSPEILLQIQDTISHAKLKYPQLLYFLDPVLGDNDRFYVPQDLTAIYKSLLPIANVITPNQFEAEQLSGIRFKSMDDILSTSNYFHKQGVQIYIQKGLKLENDTSNDLSVVISLKIREANDESVGSHLDNESQSDERYKIFIYRKVFSRLGRNFSGCGDLFTALCVAWIYRLYSDIVHDKKHYLLGDILDTVVNTMSQVLEKTQQLNKKELAIIESSSIIQDSKNNHVVENNQNKAYLLKGNVVGVIFDMDGTLTEPGAINFQAMYDRIGLKRTRDSDLISLVEAIENPKAKWTAYDIIQNEEEVGCARMKLRDDAVEVVSTLSELRIRVAISTRNCQSSVDKFLTVIPSSVGSVFSPVVTRESLNGINKPDPRVAQHIINQWGYDTTLNSFSELYGDVWFVGDSMDDMKCGKSAGCKTCLILTDYNVNYMKENPGIIDVEVSNLIEFLSFINIKGQVKD